MSGERYTKDHDFVRVEDDVAIVGITDFAQSQLGDIVFVELPSPGRRVAKGEQLATIESVKAASEIYAPISGEVVAINDRLESSPDLVNKEPLGEGWLLTLRVDDASELEDLMDEDAYRAFLESEG
ncbi:glycine cleavage system protein H [Methylosinus sp. R-45379]|uniref:glycine cleavage system protein GcvH n=1 Tax=unclassified Methylosinus TaxID=2624500 RepID=UPI0004653591|nr:MULTISPECIES: glycine cleavage system protein GcvH [unclassified Methylosinus]OAI26577.1 glycine cleavage system protein H [Methylosinus sp. R-45379]TDX67587.1 glycine cleavage system H protein [Methylosinus sp. sav-2]